MKKSLAALAIAVVVCLALVLGVQFGLPAVLDRIQTNLNGTLPVTQQGQAGTGGQSATAAAGSAASQDVGASGRAVLAPSKELLALVAQDPGKSLSERYNIPGFEELESPVDGDERSAYQLFHKANELGLDASTLANPQKTQRESMQRSLDLLAGVSEIKNTVEFPGNTGEELELFLLANPGSLVVLTQDVALKAPITLPDGARIDGAGHKLVCDLQGSAILAQDVQDIALCRLVIDGGADYGFAIGNAKHVLVRECTVSHMRGKALIFAGSCEGLLVEDCAFENNQAGAVYFSGNCSQGIVHKCVASNNTGTSNWKAGIVLTYHQAKDNPLDIWEPFTSEQRHFPTDGPFDAEIGAPHDIAIVDSLVENNQSSGVYLDGAYRCFVDNCEISGNDKEGSCLDGQTIACYVHDSNFVGNGIRARQNDDDLRLDEVLEFGRLDDGSAASKLPGLSLDNALYNVVEANLLELDSGGGVKVVRTGVRNAIVGNKIVDCGIGANHVFNFMGIELGSAGGSDGVESIDFLPSLENEVVDNAIQGSYQAGIYICPEGAGNLVRGNKVEGEGVQAISNASSRDNKVEE